MVTKVTRDVADTLFSTTPRTAVTMIGAIILAYGAMFSTFATNHDLMEFQQAYDTHVESAALWQLERVLDDVSDKRWELQQRIDSNPGQAQDIIERDRDLKKREDSYKSQISCLRAGGRNCLTGLRN